MNKPIIAIIGGGAAGMMAAATILESQKDCEILLFEKNPSLGKKVIISGGGRCNVTTGLTNRQTLMKKYTRGADFLKAAISKFPPDQVYAWFERHGVELKTEADMRVFPISNDGHDVVGVFERIFSRTNNIKLLFKASATDISHNGEHFTIKTKDQSYAVNHVVIATGGNAYRQTGSTGDGYAFATELGHTVTELGPSLNSFMTKEDWTKELSGRALEDARLIFKKTKVDGPLLFTHFGISGPVTFSLSSHMAFEPIDNDSHPEIKVIPVATMTEEKWKAFFEKAYREQPKKQLKNLLTKFFPQRFAEAFLALHGVDATTIANDLSKDHKVSLIKSLTQGLSLTLTQRRPGDEFVTAGGVPTTEINKQTMESKITPGLYFAGEIIDVDGVTGGYNLQASWAAGRLAGKSIAKSI